MDRSDKAHVSRTAVALTIAGSDSGGGAGVQADLKTFAALGVHGLSAITAITAQNTLGVRAVHPVPPGIVRAQIEAVLDDFSVGAIKIGMLASADIAEAIAAALAPSPPTPLPEGEGSAPLLPQGEGGPKGRMRAFVVYDPVLAASSGDALTGAGFVEAVEARLLPLVDCLTPNLAEAAALLGAALAGSEADMVDQGRALLALGPGAVLIKGGHLKGDEAVDLLVTAERVHRFAAPKIASPNTHGTGCTLSSAIAANVVLGLTLPEAAAAAKDFVRAAIAHAAGVRLGAGAGPLLQTALASAARRASGREE